MPLTLAECKARAREKLELAEREPRRRRKHTAAAQAWLKLASTFEPNVSKPPTETKAERAASDDTLRAAP